MEVCSESCSSQETLSSDDRNEPEDDQSEPNDDQNVPDNYQNKPDADQNEPDYDQNEPDYDHNEPDTDQDEDWNVTNTSDDSNSSEMEENFNFVTDVITKDFCSWLQSSVG